MQNLRKEYASLLGQLNEETYIHSVRVSMIAKQLATQLGLNSSFAEKAGLLHDVGKVYIPSRIMKKNHHLTVLEREIINQHSYYGYRLLKDLGEEEELCIIALLHHHNDGVVEPGDSIKPYVQLIHSVDIYEAMRSERCYHDGASKEEIKNVLNEDKLCSKRLLEAILNLNEENIPDVNIKKSRIKS